MTADGCERLGPTHQGCRTAKAARVYVRHHLLLNLSDFAPVMLGQVAGQESKRLTCVLVPIDFTARGCTKQEIDVV